MINSPYYFWSAITFQILLLAYVLSDTYKNRNHKRMMIGGVAIFVTALAMSLFSVDWFSKVDSSLQTYVINGFIILASIGANLIVASVLVPKPSEACQTPNISTCQNTTPEGHQSKNQQ